MSIYDPQSQRNLAWAGEQLGTVAGITVGGYGCFITAAAMIATHYLGRIVTPHEINQQMIHYGFYSRGDLYPVAGLHELFPDIQLQWYHDWPGPANLNDLVMADDEERMISISTAAFPTHALRVFDWDGKTLTVEDPWWGDRQNWYVHHPGIDPRIAITRVTAYRIPGWVPPWKRPKPSPPAPLPPPLPPPPPPPDPLVPVRTWYQSAPASIKS